MLMSANGAAATRTASRPKSEIRRAIQGNICRCTGYVNIVEAIAAAAERADDRDRHSPRAPSSSRSRRRSPASSAPSVPRKEDQAARPGRGRLLRRREAARHGLRPLRPLAVRARRRSSRSTSRGRSSSSGVYGTLTGDEVAILTDPFFEMSVPPGNGHQGLRARGRQDAPRRRAGRRGRRGDPRARARRGRAGRGRVRAARPAGRTPGRAGARDDARSCTRTPARTSSGRACSTGATTRARSPRRTTSSRSSELHFDRFSSTPLECSGCSRRVQPRHGPVDDVLQPPDAGHRRDLDGARAARRNRQAPLRHPGHRRRLRQQDLPPSLTSSPAACSRAS